MIRALIAIAFTLGRLALTMFTAWYLGGVLGEHLRELNRGRAEDDDLWRRSDDALNAAEDARRAAAVH